MKHKFLFLILILFVQASLFVACDSSKNKTNEPSDANNNEETNYESTYERHIKDNHIAQPPKELSDLSEPLDIDLRNSAYYWLKTVQEQDYSSYTKTNNYFHKIVFFIPYSLFNLGGNADPAILASNRKDLKECYDKNINYYNCKLSFTEKVMHKIYSSNILKELTYNWLLPEWKTTYTKLDYEKKQMIKDILNHMINYTENYNYQKELNFYRSCQGDNDYLFTSTFYVDNNGNVDYDKEAYKPYRKAEAWVFRRIHQNHMTAAEINNWLKKIKNDLSI